MEAKEKAKELVDRFTAYTWSGASFIGIEEVEMMRDNPKQCALIAVDELISENHKIEEQVGGGLYLEYWQQVKQEIEKL